MPLTAYESLDSKRIVTPHEVLPGTDVYCRDCLGRMRVHRGFSRRSGIEIVRHFYHLSDDGTASPGHGGGEDNWNHHDRATAIAVETLSRFYPDGTTARERRFSFPAGDGKRARTADAVVEFAAPHPEFGTGIVVEVEGAYGEKDILATTRAYLSEGYSVCWLSVDAFATYSLQYSKAAFEELLRNELPDVEYVFDAALNPEGIIPGTDCYPLVATAGPGRQSPSFTNQGTSSDSVPDLSLAN